MCHDQSRYGEEDVETYLFEWKSLELAAAGRRRHPNTITKEQEEQMDVQLQNPCLAKLVCRRSENERVVGFHFIGPNAGEVTQGFSLAVKMGATKSDFDSVVGIHPTDAEAFTSLSVTRRFAKVYFLICPFFYWSRTYVPLLPLLLSNYLLSVTVGNLYICLRRSGQSFAGGGCGGGKCG